MTATRNKGIAIVWKLLRRFPKSTTCAEAAQCIETLVEALEEARLIVANLPHDESLFLAKIDAALSKAVSA
jgi:hypothetical protein